MHCLFGVVLLASSAAGRVECPVGWGQSSNENVRLRIAKEWTRICMSYCWTMETNDPTKMETIVGGDWGDEQFYSRFWIKVGSPPISFTVCLVNPVCVCTQGCGGNYGTALYRRDETACSEDENEDVPGRQILVDRDRHDREIGPVSMDFQCCNKMGGDCDSGIKHFSSHSLLTHPYIAQPQPYHHLSISSFSPPLSSCYYDETRDFGASRRRHSQPSRKEKLAGRLKERFFSMKLFNGPSSLFGWRRPGHLFDESRARSKCLIRYLSFASCVSSSFCFSSNSSTCFFSSKRPPFTTTKSSSDSSFSTRLNNSCTSAI